MPGLFGVLTARSTIADPHEIVQRFKAVQAINDVMYEHRAFQSDRGVIANALTGLLKSSLDQPGRDPAGNYCLFLEGEVVNAQQLLGYVLAPWNPAMCHVLLALFMERGPDFVSLLDGSFNIAIYQPAAKRLWLLNDYLASKPLHYLEQGGAFLFGSEKKSILVMVQDSPRIDPVGLLQMFAHRHNVGGRTFIEGLKHLPAGSVLEYADGRVSLVHASTLKFTVSKSLPSASTLIKEWGDHLRQATLRRLQGKERVILSLSGGLDSRAVACAIPRDDRPMMARTRGPADALEVIYATEIARRLGFTHFREDPGVGQLSKTLPKIVWRTEGAIPFINVITLDNHRTIKQYGDFIMGGALGDVGSGAHISPLMLLPRSRRQFIEMAYQTYQLYPEAALRRVFNPEFLAATFPHVHTAFLDSFEPIESETNIQLYELWDLLERQTRMTLSASAADSYLFEHVRPFHDRDYLSFVLSLPTRLRFGQSLYQAMICQLGPEIRDVPNANTNRKLSDTWASGMLNAFVVFGNKGKTVLLKKAGRRTRGKLERAALGSMATATRGDLGLRQIIEAFVQSSDCDPAIFNRPAILAMLNEHYARAADHAHLLCVLATFAVALPYFVYKRVVGCPLEAEPLSQADEVAIYETV